jgi:hypothetical protein
MDETVLSERAAMVSNQYTICGQPGYFTVNFTSPHNAIHQITGFKSEDDAQAWIEETKRLVGTYR